jgi:ornithine carbamoyltransferase
MADFKGRSFLTLRDFTGDEITQLLDFAAKLKKEKKQGIRPQRLNGKNIALIFEKPSTRTRCAFTVAAVDEGAHPEYLGINDIQLGAKESVEDTARVLGRMFDGIQFRGFKQSVVQTLAAYAGVPVWNGLTDTYHPTQILADLLTMREFLSGEIGNKCAGCVATCDNPADKNNCLAGRGLVFVGDGRGNMANSLMIGCVKLGIQCTILAPKQLWPSGEIVSAVEGYAAEYVSNHGLDIPPETLLRITEDLDAVAGADVIYTDVWASMGEEAKAAEREALLRPYQVNAALISKANNPNVIFMHCLPAIKGKEVTEDVFEKYADVVFEEAENRMHTIKAVMVATIAGIE